MAMPIRTNFRGKGRLKYIRQPWHEETLRLRYDSRPETITALAELFHVPRYTIKQWAGDVGVARVKEHNWTEEEEEYLATWLPHRSIITIAKKLGRTKTAVALKAKRLQLTKSGEGYTLLEVCLGLGEDHHKVETWIQSGALRASRRETLRAADMWYISDEALTAFIRAHPLEINLRKVEQLWFLQLVGVIQ